MKCYDVIGTKLFEQINLIIYARDVRNRVLLVLFEHKPEPHMTLGKRGQPTAPSQGQMCWVMADSLLLCSGWIQY